MTRADRVVLVDLQDRRGVIDAAVEQRRIARREVERGDRDAVAIADRHRLDLDVGDAGRASDAVAIDRYAVGTGLRDR